MNVNAQRSYSLQNRLLWFMLVILFSSILVIALYAGHILRQNLRVRLGERQLAVATMVAADIDKSLQVRWNYLVALGEAAGPGLLVSPATVQSLLDDRMAAGQLFDGGIIAFAADGKVIAQTPSQRPELGTKLAPSDLLESVQKRGQGRIAPLDRSLAGALPSVAITVPIRDASGTVIGGLTGVTVVTLPTYLDQLSPDHSGIAGDFLLVVPKDDGFTTLTRKTSIPAELSAIAVEKILDRLARSSNGTFVFVDPTGAEVIASDRRIPSADWHLVAALPTAETLALVGDAQRSALLLTLLLMLVSGLLMKRVLQRELAPLLAAATALSSRSTAHELARPLPIQRHDEVGRLISGFNGLLETLGKREAALRESEDRYRLLIESTAEAIWVIQHGYVKFANAAMCRTMGSSAEELRARPFIEFVHPESREVVAADCQACIDATGDDEKRAIRVMASGRDETWLAAGGVQISWAGSAATLILASDVSEQRSVKLELARVGELLERTSEFAQIGGWRLELDTQRLLWTRETYRIHELATDEPIDAQRAMSFYPPGARTVLEAALQEAIENGKRWDLELPLITAQGRTIWVRAQGAPESRDGKVVAVGGAFQDVTARRQMESQVRQSEKLAAIGQLAAGVAHEINNPVAFVNSNLGALRKYVNDLFAVIAAYETVPVTSSEMSQAYANVNTLKAQVELEYLKEDLPALLLESAEGLERVKTIVLGLKDFTRADSNDTWQFSDLKAGIESTLKVIWNELKYKCEVVTEFAELPPVECVPGQLNQVFMNLLVNAANAIAQRGVIRLRTGCQDESVWVEVSDSGEGIEPGILPRIFDPFFTTKPVGKGTGLGLAVSQRIVEAHHGRIEVESVPGQGATFRIWLPIRQPQHRETIQ